MFSAPITCFYTTLLL